MQMKDFYPVLDKDRHVVLANKEVPKLYYEGDASQIPHQYDDYFVQAVGFSREEEVLFLISKHPVN